jgi:hypothetical protein
MEVGARRSPCLGRRWRKEPAAGKTLNAAGSERLRMDGELGKHEDASAHPLDCLVEDGRRRSGL